MPNTPHITLLEVCTRLQVIANTYTDKDSRAAGSFAQLLHRAAVELDLNDNSPFLLLMDPEVVRPDTTSPRIYALCDSLGVDASAVRGAWGELVEVLRIPGLTPEQRFERLHGTSYEEFSSTFHQELVKLCLINLIGGTLDTPHTVPEEELN